MYRHNVKAPLKNDPSVSFADSSPYAGEPREVRRCCRVRLPPLCKGRWVGVSRLGGVVFLVAHIHLLRQHDRRMRGNRKKGRAMPAPTLWFLVREWFLEAEWASPFPTGCRQRFCTKSAQFHGMRNAMVCSALSIPGKRNKRIRSCVRAPLKSCVRGGGSALAEPVGLCFQISAASPHTLIIHYSLFTRKRSLRLRAAAINV